MKHLAFSDRFLLALARVLREDVDSRDSFIHKLNNDELTSIDIENTINAPVYFKSFYEGDPYFGPLDWPEKGETMTSIENLLFLKEVCKDIHERNIEGEIVETGLWRGGCLIYMKICSDFYGDHRIAHGFDSFVGCPTPELQTEKDKMIESSAAQCRWNDHFTVSRNDVEVNFLKYGIDKEEFTLVEGWFHETLPNADIEKISILRLDGDCYSSTIIALENMYDKVSVGGYVIIDDYDLECCKLALEDFLETRQIEPALIETSFGEGVIYWIKE